MFSSIRHIAIYTEHYHRTANFYQNIFGMRKITTGMTNDKGEYDLTRGHLSDGVIGFAFLQRQAGIRSGLDHFGFNVENIDIVIKRLERNYPEVRIARSLEHVPFSVMRIQDPVGTHIDVSQKGVAKVREGYVEEGWEQPRHLKHIAIRAAKPAALAEFYRNVFELQQMESASEKGDICMSDGTVFILIRPCETTSYLAMTEGLDHIGFQVESLEKIKKELEEIGKSFPDSAPKKIDLGRYGSTTKKELEACVLGRYAASDPDGVLIDFSE